MTDKIMYDSIEETKQLKSGIVYGVTPKGISMTNIDQFQVQYSSNLFPPRIWLLNSGKYIGQLIFLPDGTTLPPDSKVNNQVNLYYHLEDFENIYSILSDEKPVNLLFAGVGSGNENGIQTSPILIGK
jgi:hypothetical protein